MPKKNLYARLLTIDDYEIDWDDPKLWRKSFANGLGQIMEHCVAKLHKKEAATKVAKNMMLLDKGYSIAFIADIVGESEEFVQSIQNKLIQKRKILPPTKININHKIIKNW